MLKISFLLTFSRGLNACLLSAESFDLLICAHKLEMVRIEKKTTRVFARGQKILVLELRVQIGRDVHRFITRNDVPVEHAHREEAKL